MDLDGFARTRFTASTIDVPGTPAVAGAIMFHAIALLALGGALLRRVRRAPGGLWLLVLLQFVTTVFVISETPRFRTPLEPFFLIAAACGIEFVGVATARRIRRGRLSAASSGLVRH